MGVLPLSFKDGQKWSDLNLKGNEEISILGISEIEALSAFKMLNKAR